MVKTINKNDIIFVKEQDGDAEREFKNELSNYFLTTEKNIRAYLAQVCYQSSQESNIVLCLKIDTKDDARLVEKCSDLFKTTFSNSEHLDILFINSYQELELRKLCCPFYTSQNFQIEYPDFYLISKEGYNLDRVVRKCFKQKRLYGKHPDGYILCDIEPSISGQAFNLGDKNINTIIIASRHKGFSLFPIREWPFYVHAARPLINNIVLCNDIQTTDIELIAWAELYKEGKDIES